MNEDVGLFADILEHPHDDTPRLIYADWLEDRAAPGDAPRAAFIRLQIDLARAPSADLLRREKAMLTQYGRLWTRDLRPALSRLGWRRGFVESAAVFASVFLATPDAVLGLAPLRRLRFRDPSGH
ncbi:MAG: TIGR02996 domain-containing protein, partial [Gemmataceae bacterium]